MLRPWHSTANVISTIVMLVSSVRNFRLRMLAMPGVVPAEGGVPISVDGKIVGAIGVSGGTSAQDGQCANAGISSLT